MNHDLVTILLEEFWPKKSDQGISKKLAPLMGIVIDEDARVARQDGVDVHP